MAKVIRKSNKKGNKRANQNTIKRTNKNKKNNSRSKVMRGGDDGRYVLPPAYFGGNKNGYVANFSNLSGAVSQGMVSENGKSAGPNLYPSLGLAGGGCGCSGKKSKSKSHKSRKSKSKINKRH